MTDSFSPKALFFDMDGVLVDSLDSWWKSLNYALRETKHQYISRDFFIRELWGLTLQENLEKLGVNVNKNCFCDQFYESFIDDVKLFQSTRMVLDRLSDYPKAIITNTPERCTRKILRNFEIEKYFSVVITSDMIEKGKPNPDMIFLACEKLDVNPAEVVLIGDTENDVKAGKAAGSTTVGVNTDADYVIGDLKNLIDLILNY